MSRPDATLELPLSSVMSHALFPGRSALLAAEVAKAVHCSINHVFNLIDCGRLEAIDIATGNVIERGKAREHRRTLRVPVSSYDAFLRASRTA